MSEKITWKTECWFCKRTAEEIQKLVEGYYDLTDLKSIMFLQKLFPFEKDFSVPVCVVCHNLVIDINLDELKESIGIKNLSELLTKGDV